MTLNPAQRPTMEQVLAHPWMQGSCPSNEEIRTDFARRKGLVDAEAHSDREQKRQQRADAKGTRTVRRSGNHAMEEGEEPENPRDAWQNLEVTEYGPYFVQDYTQFFMTSSPLDYFDDLVEFLNKKEIPYRISGSNLKLAFTTQIGAASAGAEESKEAEVREVKCDIQVLKVNDNKSCVKFSYKDPVKKVDLNTSPDIINHFMSIRNEESLRMFCDTTYDEQ